MKKVVEFLTANPVQYLATVGRDGKAKCRPFMFCFEQDGKLWFCNQQPEGCLQGYAGQPLCRGHCFQPQLCLDPPARQGRV